MIPLWILLFFTVVTCAPGQGLRENLPPEQSKREGEKLVSELRSLVPVNNYTNVGTMEIKQRGSAAIEIPIRFTVAVEPGRWVSCYEALDATMSKALNALTIIKRPGQPSLYFSGTLDDVSQIKSLTAEEVATQHFAGSDFWAFDLGLEFLQWPDQRVLRKDMRSGQSCNVLESTTSNAPSGGYSRVVSWIDIDTGGVVYAESFDADRKRLKEFAPKAFKKVDGEWQLEEMRIEDLTRKSKTTIFFEVGKK